MTEEERIVLREYAKTHDRIDGVTEKYGLDRDVPMKPLTATAIFDYDPKTGIVDGLRINACPKCRSQLMLLNTPKMYCSVCGQAINLEEEVE